ncbi:MAG TPA: acyl-CoA dehydrogenase family protein [Solirubrobacteraceae bacterium]|nr:acyl-CoA dehydrogenase family protein [Solirubrobacteraceae bacterium]
MSTSSRGPAADRSLSPQSMLTACQELVHDEVMPQVETWDRDDVLPQAILDRLSTIGVPAAMVPTRYGGPELSVADLVPVWRTLAQGWISLTGAVNTTYLGTALLLRYGTEAQRKRWLPAIASGGVWSSFSITEPQAGSDVQHLETEVEPADDGLIITGAKQWIAGGISFPLAFMLATERGAERPSCVVLPATGRGSDSWQTQWLEKVGYRGVESAAWTFVHHHAVGAEILGGEDGRGRGLGQMIDVLAIGRVNVACRALGIIDRALTCALEESTTRVIGDGLLGNHTHARLRIGELRARQRAVEAVIDAAARGIDTGDPEAGELASAAKVIASDTAIWAVDTASRLAASRSYTWESELARLRRDAPQTQIGEGANDALLLSLGKTLIRSAAAGPLRS